MGIKILTWVMLVLAAFFYVPGSGFAGTHEPMERPRSSDQTPSSDTELPRRPLAVRG